MWWATCCIVSASPPHHADPALVRSLRRSLTTRGGAFVAAGLLLVVGGMLMGLSDLIRVGALLVAMVVLAAFWGRRMDLEVTRTIAPAVVSIDEGALVTVRATNRDRGRSPLCQATEVLPPSLGDRPRVILGAMGAGESREFQYTVRPHQRGVHPVGPLRIEVSDPFGLTSRPAVVAGRGSLVVLPRVFPLAASRRLLGGAGSEGSIPQGVALHGEDDQTIRTYRDGDDLRRIHWPATARTGDLMVRQEDRPTRRHALIVLDSRAVAHDGTGRSATLEWAVSLTASMAAHLARHAHRVRLVTADPTADSGARTDEDLDAAMFRLAEVQLDRSESLIPVLHAAQDRTTGGGLVIAVVGGLDDETVRTLSALRPHGARGLAFVVNPSRASERAGVQARGTLAGLRAAGWDAVAVDGHTAPPQVWSVAVGAEAAMTR